MFIPGKFNDTLIRNAVIEFFKTKFKVNLKHNDVHNRIDLVGVNTVNGLVIFGTIKITH